MVVAPRTDSMVFSSGIYELRHQQRRCRSHLDLSRVATGVLSPNMKNDGLGCEARRVEVIAPTIRFQPGAGGRRQHVRDLESLREWSTHRHAHLAVRRGHFRCDLPLAIRGPSRKTVDSMSAVAPATSARARGPSPKTPSSPASTSNATKPQPRRWVSHSARIKPGSVSTGVPTTRGPGLCLTARVFMALC